MTQNNYILLEIGQVSSIYVFNTREKIIIIKKHNALVEPTESTWFNNVQVGWNLNLYCLFPSLTSCKTMFNFNLHKVLSCNYARKHCLLIQIPKMVHRCLSTNSNPLLIQAENSTFLNRQLSRRVIIIAESNENGRRRGRRWGFGNPAGLETEPTCTGQEESPGLYVQPREL